MAQAPATSYYIPHHGFGAIQSIPVHPTSDAPTNKTLTIDAATSGVPGTEFTVTLRPQENGTLGVFASTPKTNAPTNTLLGTISPADRAEYPELDLILNAGLYPTATARVQESGLVLRLPRPGLCLPANNPPSSQWVLLGHGPLLRVHNIVDSSGILPDGRAHLLVTLKSASKGKDEDTTNDERTKPGIGIYLGNHFLAPLGDAPSTLLTTVRHNEDEGITTLAHAFHSPRHGHRELDIFAGQPSSAGAGPEWQLAQSAPRSASVAQTFETSSFRVITDADLAALDRISRPTASDSGTVRDAEEYDGLDPNTGGRTNQRAFRLILFAGALTILVVLMVLLILSL
ncbi:hypothetical protein [Corynebacterium flavescens]|uniref:Uncharacterized protein n=1 Tax=Corynebacterium flavescens TaxID=28028 RepID=A0A1L7CJH1_CORFL|nr:hypothetical protein [Corynebacterium flavescens]APT85959.1 hypothetical protein CFLV_01275 [Corynebacterium flavescens]KAA8724760.1 hypothetical protein F4V60_01210 [Corynebacterium flavescens]GEB98668.1 hypothetical protein CFL01nite_21630 [Corynebacterium flavescens]